MRISNENAVIFVDDDEDDLIIAKSYYQRSALENNMLMFSSGKEFLEYMDSVAGGIYPMPALVLMDINMPEINGFETLENLRTISKFETQPPVIFLTTSDYEKDQQKAETLQAGFQPKLLGSDYINFLSSLSANDS